MNKKVVIFWSIFIAAAMFRVLQSLDTQPSRAGDCVKQIVDGVGTIIEEPEQKETGQVIVVLVESLNIAGITDKSAKVSENSINSPKPCSVNFLIKIKTKSYPRFVYGDRISFKGKLLEPINFDSGSDRSFDYRGYLAKDDIYYEMKSATVDLIDSMDKLLDKQSDHGGVSMISATLFSLKRKFVWNLERTLGEPHAALAAGLVVGEKAALGKDLLDDFRAVGLIHIVVLSGYNITVVGEAMRRILSFMPRIWGITFGGAGIALFGILVGGGATVVRSCFMAGIALSASLMRRDYDVTRALVFVALIMLIQNPMILLHDPSFQLSFLATLGLILLASPIENRLGFITEKFGIRGIVASTIATQIFVSPYILYMMGQISIIGMLVNILVLPFIPITMLFVFLTGAIGMIPFTFCAWISQFFGWISHALLSYELYMVQNFAQFPLASVHLPVFSGWWVVGFYALFAVAFAAKKFFSTTSQLRLAKKSSM